jgi:hypothetical protein
VHGRPTATERAAKGAELASGLSAIVLGAGIALVLPDGLRAHAVPLLIGGALVHAIGMTLKYRLESRDGPPLWWGADIVLAMLGLPGRVRPVDCSVSHRSMTRRLTFR